MRVVDAGVVVDLLVGSLDYAGLQDQDLAAPHLIDSEVLNVLRGLVRRGVLTGKQGDIAVAGFIGLSLSRYSAEQLRPRIWELRDNLSAYDATYAALAECLGVPLLTTDARIARAPGVRCPIEVV